MKRLAACAIVWSWCCGCAGEQGPPRHPVAEMSARATARIGVIELVVAEPQRAEQVREVYLQLAALADEFDRARARSMLQARPITEERAADGTPGDAATLEAMLAPPLAQSRALFDRYAALMQQARSLLTPQEFDTLNRVR